MKFYHQMTSKTTFKIITICILLIFSSCAKKNYSALDRKNNNSFTISSNLPGYSVELRSEGKRDKESFSPVSSQSNNGRFQTTFSFDKLKFGRTFLVVEGPNYDPVKIKVWRSPRWSALGKDLALSLITYGVPLLVDGFRSDFYKVASFSKKIKVNLKYSQEYMKREFLNIENSTDPQKFQAYINQYPYSNYLNAAVDKKDSCELQIAINQYSEEAIENFISTHQKSKFLAEANDIMAGMVEAREEFEKAKVANSEPVYKSYIDNYPKSIYRKQAVNLYVSLAFKNASAKNSLQELTNFNKSIFIPYEAMIWADSLEPQTERLITLIDKQIIKENDTDPKNKYVSYSKVWSVYQKVQAENSNLFANNLYALEQCRTYEAKIADLVLLELSKLTTKQKQSEYLSKSEKDFVGYVDRSVSEEEQKNFIATVVEKSSTYSGAIKLFDQVFYRSYLNGSYEGVPLKNLLGYEYRGVRYSNFEQANYEELTLKNGQINSLKLFKDKTILCSYTRLNDGNTEYAYYMGGKLARTNIFHPTDYDKSYYYEFDNGVNLSLKTLDQSIKKAEAEIAKKNFDLALDILQNECKNTYPATLAQNVKVKNTLKNCNTLKAQELARLEQQEREKEIFNQSLLSGRYDNLIEDKCYENMIKEAANLYLTTGSGEIKNINPIFNNAMNDVGIQIGHELTNDEKIYFKEVGTKYFKRLNSVMGMLNTTSSPKSTPSTSSNTKSNSKWKYKCMHPKCNNTVNQEGTVYYWEKIGQYKECDSKSLSNGVGTMFKQVLGLRLKG
jgi:hypothetical protein